jgi:peptidoglycan/xylan/chitin deacetylase (PgdA/CDA1 family)
MKRIPIVRKLKKAVVLTLALMLFLSVLTPVASAWWATPSSNLFTDVQPHDWHNDYISWAWINGITTGTSPTTFEPESNVTRAQFATFIHRVAGTPSASPSAFADSGTIESWAVNAVGWASSSGVTTGFLDDNTFRPNSNITREQIATMLYRHAQYIGLDTTVPENAMNAFPDSGHVSGWAATAMSWAVHNRIITGMNGNLAPQNNATRAQSVTMLNRYVNTFGISAVNLPPPPVVPGQAFISHLYREALGIVPDQNSLIRWSRDISRGVPGAAIAHSLIFSPEMNSRNLSNADYVDMLFMSLLGRSATAQERSSLVNELNRGATGFSVFAGVIRSAEFARFCSTFNVIPGNAVDPSRPMVALTFDDGPTGFTNSLLDVLETYNAAATFYMSGQNIASDRNVVLRAFNLRSEIGNHGWTFADPATLPLDMVRDEIASTSNAIQSITGVAPVTFRPSYGGVNANVRAITAEYGMPIILWTLFGEYNGVSYFNNTWDVYNQVVNNVKPGDVVLLHDTYADIVPATEMIIMELFWRGYQLVTVSELLFYSNIVLSPSQVFGSMN